MLRFVERQTVFVLETTADVKTYHDFLTNMSGMVLFNSTCMCLQTIGETTRQVDDLTAGNLLPVTRRPHGSKSSECVILSRMSIFQ
mgnify:CR=1 FL=1